MGLLTRRESKERRFVDRVAVVTGASSGLGRRFAVDLAERDAIVVGLARRADLLAEVETKLRESSPRSRALTCDVSDTEAYVAALRAIESEIGRIDVLLNNAGVEAPTPVDMGFNEAYRRIFEINFFGTVAGTLAVLPGMTARGEGIIVNVASDTARAPGPETGAYAASKAAIAAFTESVAHEVADRGVHVHVLYPAWVPTAMGMSAIDEGVPMPPKPVRRTEAQVSELLLRRMGAGPMEINAAALPLLAPIGRTLAPGLYERSMRRRFAKLRATNEGHGER